jgi:putative ABC transport system permease protein
MLPPSLAERLLTRRLKGDVWGENTLGDLREEFAAMAQRNEGAARRWYWRETIRLLIQPAAPSPDDNHPRKDPLMRTLLSEARLAARALRRQPTTSIAIILTLAVALGVNAATFGMIDALLLRPFTIPTVDRLVVLSELTADMPFPQESVAPGNYIDLKQHDSRTLTRLSTVSWGDVNMSGGDQPERLQGSQVGAGLFEMLGAVPADGRFFQANDEVDGSPRTVVISERLWQRRFGARPNVVGSTILLDGHPHTVIGRAPAGFDFPNGSDVWTPLWLSADERTNRTARFLTVVGELAPDATVDDARAEMTTVYARLKDEHQVANRDYSLVVDSFSSAMVDFGMPRVLGLWQAAALLLLLIAGTNVANLFLARGAERQREIAVRLAIGASRWRLVRQLLIESAVLSMVAVPAALAVAALSIQLIRGMMPAELLRFLPGWSTMSLNPRVALVTGGIALISAVLFGLLPALRASRPSLTTSLKDGGRSSTSGVGRSRLRRGLVVAEIALALPLLLSAGLAAIAGHRMASGPQGYDPEGLVRIRMTLPEATYPDADARRRFTTDLLSTTPAAQQVVTTTVAPSSSNNSQRRVVVEGRPEPPAGPRSVNYRAVSSGFHEVLRIPIVDGRGFTTGDRDDSQHVAIVSQSLADLYWPEESPLGRRVKLSATAEEWITIVGISGNVLDDWFSSRNAPTIYVPVDQWPSNILNVIARGPGDPASRITALRSAVSQVDPTLPVFDTGTMQAAIRTRTTGLRFISQLMAAFGVLALILASAGIYGVMAHYVAQRRHEIGVRMALGATTRGVLRLTMGQGLRMSLLGIVLGTALGVAAARVLESMLFGVIAIVPVLFVVGPMVLVLVAALATLIPAQSAIRVDPATVLRE